MSNKNYKKFTIYGEPASKANARQLVNIKGRIVPIKSKKALAYLKDFAAQCPVLLAPYTDDVFVLIKIYYASRRPDLDESLILDCMQGPIYANDRQVKIKLISWALDKENPRTDITVGIISEDMLDDFAASAERLMLP